MKRFALSDTLCVMTLFAFALAQPLYDLLSRNVAFLHFHHSQPIDILLLVTLLSIVFPLLLTGVLCILPKRRYAHALIMTVLLTIFFIPILGRQESMSSTLVVSLSLVLSGVVIWARYRYNSLRSFFAALSPALIVFPTLFLCNSEVGQLLYPKDEVKPLTVEVKKKHPVIVVVFDEFPLASILNNKHEVDAGRYPNFAALAGQSCWFRQATAVHTRTDYSLPAIFTGNRVREPDLSPTSANFPRNLFTLLGNSHQPRLIRSGYSATMCPASLNTWNNKPSFGQRMNVLFRDLLVVEGHLILPKFLKRNLPAIDTNWTNFYCTQKSFNDSTAVFNEFLESLTPTGNRPSLHFLHFMKPHTPFSYLPSGKAYGRDTFIFGLGTKKVWKNDPEQVALAQQRHLLQVGYVDKLLGSMIRHLKKTGVYDDCLLVITSDHGISFQAGKPYRWLNDSTYADVLRVPLFIKLPNQRQGRTSDLNVEHVDILPTIADVLDVNVPWPMEGSSVFTAAELERDTKLVIEDEIEYRYGPKLNLSWGGLHDRLQRFGSGSWERLFQHGPAVSLYGQSVYNLAMDREPNIQVELQMPELYDSIALDSTFIPARIQGILKGVPAQTESVHLAIAVNGVIRATTEVQRDDTFDVPWYVMVAEDSFHAGKNVVEICSIDMHTQQLTLLYSTKQRASKNTYRLIGDSVVTNDGQTLPIRKRSIIGYLDRFHADESCVTFLGWAAEVKAQRPADRILLFADGSLIHEGPLNRNRPDVAKSLGDESYAISGFNYCIPRERLRGLENSQLRLFALSKNQVVSELNYNDWYLQRDLTPLKR